MSDIVERLRDLDTATCEDAADEIERLRAALARIDKMEVYQEDARDVLWAKIGIMRYIARAALEVK